MSRFTALSSPPNSSAILGLTALHVLFAVDSICRQITFTHIAIDGSGLTATVSGGHGGYVGNLVVTSSNETINQANPAGSIESAALRWR